MFVFDCRDDFVESYVISHKALSRCPTREEMNKNFVKILYKHFNYKNCIIGNTSNPPSISLSPIGLGEEMFKLLITETPETITSTLQLILKNIKKNLNLKTYPTITLRNLIEG